MSLFTYNYFTVGPWKLCASSTCDHGVAKEIFFSPFFWLFSKICNFAIVGEIRRGMDKMSRALEIYPYCTLALNHLANQYFFTGQHFVVEQLSETALSSSSHGLLKSQSYYNLARSYHSKVMYPIHIPIELVGYYFTFFSVLTLWISVLRV